jgi:hypothetical protein
MKTALLILLTVLASRQLPAQELVLLPRGLNFSPLRSNLQEPRIGLLKSTDAGEMRVDIGNTIDLISVRGERLVVASGIDFFTYALVNGSDGLRLQIDAVDGFFGGNVSASYRCDSSDSRWLARLRLLHQSAHLVDGSSSIPVPYTRDFGELVVARQLGGTVRTYAGLSYATLVRPGEIERLAYLAGIEIADDRILGAVAGEPLNLYVAYTAAASGTPAYALSHTLQAGVKLGRFFEKGPAVFAEWYSGRHMLAEYYNQRLSFIGVGFAVDFF